MHCENCGRFMRLTDYLPRDDEEFDEELAFACGFTQEEFDTLSPFEEPLCRFNYVQNLWECSECDLYVVNTEGEKHYYNPETNFYDAPKPVTLKEKAEQERIAQEAAGQLRMNLE